MAIFSSDWDRKLGIQVVETALDKAKLAETPELSIEQLFERFIQTCPYPKKGHFFRYIKKFVLNQDNLYLCAKALKIYVEEKVGGETFTTLDRWRKNRENWPLIDEVLNRNKEVVEKLLEEHKEEVKKMLKEIRGER